MGNVTWTHSWNASDNGTVFGGADLQNIQNDITTVVNGGITNTNVNASAAIAESKIAFDISSGHNHDGVGSKSIAVSENTIGWGFEIVDTTADAMSVTVRPGLAYWSTTRVSKTVNTILTFGSADDWYDGATDTYAGGAGWCYVGYKSTGDVKLLGANSPNCHDTSGNAVAGATDIFFDDTGGGSATYWRVIGAVYVDTDNKIHANGAFRQIGNYLAVDIPVNVLTGVSSGAWSAAISCSAVIPAISRMALFGVYNASGSASGTAIRPNGGTWEACWGTAAGISAYSGSNTDASEGQLISLLDTSQRIQYYNTAGSGQGNGQIDVHGYWLNIR
jgi:hypothetical protein